MCYAGGWSGNAGSGCIDSLTITGVGFFDGWCCDAIRTDRQKPVRADVFRIRTPCGRAEARPYGKNLPMRTGASGPRKKVFSVWCGGKAATPNRKHYNPGRAQAPPVPVEGGKLPALPHLDEVELWVMIRRQGEVGRERGRIVQPNGTVLVNRVLRFLPHWASCKSPNILLERK